MASTPPRRSSSISSNSAATDSTTPLPIRHITPSRSTPDGIRCSTVFLPLMTSVCRAHAGHHAVAQHTRRDQVQHGFLAVDDQRVPGVVSTLETHHGVRAVGQQVDDFPLAFVTPLGADHDDVLSHVSSLYDFSPQINADVK